MGGRMEEMKGELKILREFKDRVERGAGYWSDPCFYNYSDDEYDRGYKDGRDSGYDDCGRELLELIKSVDKRLADVV